MRLLAVTSPSRSPATPDIRERFSSLGLQPVGGTSEQWTALIQNELVKWAKLVRENGIAAN